jgi:hypothetical protein
MIMDKDAKQISFVNEAVSHILFNDKSKSQSTESQTSSSVSNSKHQKQALFNDIANL